jgi:hypothetical protein
MTSIVEEPAVQTLPVSPLSYGEDWAKGRLHLPGGILSNTGTLHKVILVRELTGVDEELLSDRRFRNSVDQVTELLVRAIQRVEGMEAPIDERLVADMLIGDRDYIVLRLRQITMGDQVHQVMRCPNTACGEKVDVEFLVSEIPVKRVDQLQATYEFELSCPAITDDERSHRGFLRLPTGRDQSAIADMSNVNPAAANTRLFSRIVLSLGKRETIDEELVRALSMKVRSEITAFLRDVSPGPDLTIDTQCPHCGSGIMYPFDLCDFFFDECVMSLDNLYREIHSLAFHYHWAERDILAMNRAKRSRYLSLLVQQLEQPENTQEGG